MLIAASLSPKPGPGLYVAPINLTGNFRWRTVWEFPAQPFVSFVSVHQADVTLKALSPP